MGGVMDSVVDALSPEGRTRVRALLMKRWALPGEHPLAALHGAGLGGYRLVVLLGPKSSVGSQTFQLLLTDGAGRPADPSPALGLFNRGPYPAFNWIELTRYDSKPAIGGQAIDLVAEGLDLRFFEMLSALVPAGGHMMVEYDSPGQRATERMLTLGYPPPVTPLGLLLFQVGCRSYKNWHISEGWREGPRKLQGFKPWNEEIAREKTDSLRAEVSTYLRARRMEEHSVWDAVGRQNAEAILRVLSAERALGTKNP
jgi:hypothetical protein